MTDEDDLVEVRGIQLTAKDASLLRSDPFVYGCAFVEVVRRPDGTLAYQRLDPSMVQIVKK